MQSIQSSREMGDLFVVLFLALAGLFLVYCTDKSMEPNPKTRKTSAYRIGGHVIGSGTERTTPRGGSSWLLEMLWALVGILVASYVTAQPKGDEMIPSMNALFSGSIAMKKGVPELDINFVTKEGVLVIDGVAKIPIFSPLDSTPTASDMLSVYRIVEIATRIGSPTATFTSTIWLSSSDTTSQSQQNLVPSAFSNLWELNFDTLSSQPTISAVPVVEVDPIAVPVPQPYPSLGNSAPMPTTSGRAAQPPLNATNSQPPQPNTQNENSPNANTPVLIQRFIQESGPWCSQNQDVADKQNTIGEAMEACDRLL